MPGVDIPRSWFRRRDPASADDWASVAGNAAAAGFHVGGWDSVVVGCSGTVACNGFRRGSVEGSSAPPLRRDVRVRSNARLGVPQEPEESGALDPRLQVPLHRSGQGRSFRDGECSLPNGHVGDS